MGKTKSWADRVNALIKDLGSVEWVAAKCGVSAITVRRWADKVYEPSRLAQNAIEELEKEGR